MLQIQFNCYVYLPNSIAIFGPMNPTCAVNVVHHRQGHSLGDQDLMKFLDFG